MHTAIIPTLKFLSTSARDSNVEAVSQKNLVEDILKKVRTPEPKPVDEEESIDNTDSNNCGFE